MRDRLAAIRERLSPALGASRTDRRFSLPRQLAVACAAAAFMAVVAPLGTEHATLLKRLGYWLTLMLLGTLLSNGVTRWAVRLDLFERRPWVWAGLVTLCITPPLSIAVWALSGAMFGLSMRPMQILGYAPAVLVISSAMLALTVLSQRIPVQTHAGPKSAAPPPFMARLPPKLRGADIHALQAEDHYLRLHTSAGQDLILMRLSDAIAELEGVEGAQVHRSWWVARDAVLNATRGDGRATLNLKTGAVAPVSRTYARALREAGWF
jgi:hypothetical protein